MNTRAFVAVVGLAFGFLLSDAAFSKTASCPCSPCKCSPCTCGGSGGGGKDDKHHHRDRDHDHAGGGVGVNVDLGGVGQRKAEPDPFAVSGGSPSSVHTEERHKTKTKDHEGTSTDTFNQIQLTGEDAKDETVPDMPPSTVNILDDKNDETPATQEKKKDKPKLPKVVQQWFDKWKAFIAANRRKFDTRSAYHTKLVEFCKKDERYKQLYYQALALGDPLDQRNMDNKNYEAERKKADEDLDKREKTLEKDFLQTDAGKTALKDRDAAEQAEKDAYKAQAEAGEYIDQATKDVAINGKAPETEAQKSDASSKANK